MTDQPPLRVVTVNGSLSTPSRTGALISVVADNLAERMPVDIQRVDLAAVAPGFAGSVTREAFSPEVQDALNAVEQADLLIVGTPVYRATFTGLFKHFFDFIDQYGLVGTPVLLTATGGSERHSLTIEHQLRPLFGFFQALTLPLGVYGSATDFVDGKVASPSLTARISEAVDRGLPLLRARQEPHVPAFW